MPPQSKRQLAYSAQVAELFANYNNEMLAYSNRVKVLLERISDKLSQRIMSISEKNWVSMNLSQISADLQGLLADFNTQYDAVMLSSLRTSSASGQGLVIDPLEAHLDTSAMWFPPTVYTPVAMDANIRATWNITHTLITNVTDEIGSEIMNKIVLGMMEGTPRFKVIQDIMGELGGQKLGFTNLNSRAWAIYRTESNRMFNIAKQLQMRQALEIIPGMKKQWHHGVILDIGGGAAKGYTPRPGHVALDGITIPFEEAFVNPNTGTMLMYPHDPTAPAQEVINCGCAHTLAMPSDSYLKKNTLITV